MWDCNRTKESEPPCIEGVNCSSGNYANFWYFYMLVLLCSHVMLNLFILVIIQQFEHYYLQSDNSISNYKNDLVSFIKVWKKWTQDRYQCKKIKEKNKPLRIDIPSWLLQDRESQEKLYGKSSCILIQRQYLHLRFVLASFFSSLS